MKKILIVLSILCMFVLTSCNNRECYVDNDNWTVNFQMKCVNGHIYLYNHNSNTVWEHDKDCPKCLEMKTKDNN